MFGLSVFIFPRSGGVQGGFSLSINSMRACFEVQPSIVPPKPAQRNYVETGL